MNRMQHLTLGPVRSQLFPGDSTLLCLQPQPGLASSVLIFLPHYNGQTHYFLNNKFFIQKRKNNLFSVLSTTLTTKDILTMNCLKMNGVAR